jgi:hypothetical protein
MPEANSFVIHILATSDWIERTYLISNPPKA